MSATAKPAASAVSVAVKAARYPETAIITLTEKGCPNPKRAASAKRFAGYGSKPGDTVTVKDYLDHCVSCQPDEPRYRWRADLDWDVKRGFITIATK